MLSISGKEYNIEILFQYETLKEVLIALAKNNLEIKDNIDSLQINEKENKKKIEELENKIKSMNEYNEQKFNNLEINFKEILNNFLNQNDNKNKSSELLQIEKLKEKQKELYLTNNNDNNDQDKLISPNILNQFEKKIKENQMRIEELEKNTKDFSAQTEINDLENLIEKNLKNIILKMNI